MCACVGVCVGPGVCAYMFRAVTDPLFWGPFSQLQRAVLVRNERRALAQAEGLAKEVCAHTCVCLCGMCRVRCCVFL